LRREGRLAAVIVEPWSEEHARTVLEWHYEPPYDFYDMASDPHDAAELLERPELYRAVLEDGELIGFFYFSPRGDEVELGLALRPDLTGRGRGAGFSRAALDYAREQWSPRAFRLYVAAWNERAIRVYERLGFLEVARQTRSFELVGEHEFVEMELGAIDTSC
jgi:RimJ/RimL family protein N-acetyltransferase